MAVVNAPEAVKSRARLITAVVTIVGYVVVLGTLGGYAPEWIFPNLDRGGIRLFAHVIAAVNTVNVVVLLAGWRFIRRGQVRKHAAAMGTGFCLILVFLVLYLVKVGGGGTRHFAGPALASYIYFAALAVHILLSILAVPLVVHALVLGLTHTPAELRQATPHRRVGRLAAGSWIVSLVLGVFTYLMLNHLYDATLPPAALALP